ncbi:MAG TPA: hypothetical protein VFW92_06900 [Candidatus Limnocylindrales bacterium]|nr:hypothetical protein [Candidatus Limnocylindrales bacterium]
MSPAEFFFLAVGLILGVAAGAAVLDVLRARPPRPEVHLTITREALPRRAAATGGPEAARDPVAVDVPAASDPPPTAHVPQTAGPSLALSGPAAPVPPLTVRPGPAATRTDGRVPIAVGRGLDPTLAALRAVARERQPSITTRPISGIRRPFATVMAAGARGSAGGEAVHGRAAASDDPSAGGSSAARAARAGNGGGSGARSGGAASGGRGSAATSSGRARGAGPTGSGQPPAGPCGAERLLADERCAVASQARERAEEVAGELRQAQRAYDTATARADAAAKTSDPRAVADAKEAARQRFRAASRAARARADLEAAATEWLNEINRINHERREASEVAAEARQTAAQLLGTIERLTLAADASRITAAAAASACMEARQLLADCEERSSQVPAPAVAPPPPARAPVQAPTGATALLEALQRPLEVPAEPGDEGGLPSAPTYRVDDHQPAIFRLLQGDRQTLLGVVDGLAGADREERQRTQQLLTEMVEAVVAGAIEACVLDFPTEHPFWADFDRSQCRDIAVALASLGYRFDGLGGFVDDRLPSQRDLSLAVGYAGLDPMRIRRWPTEAEMARLYGEVRVAADEYLADRAPDLTLGEMVTLLGRRSEPLAELWNAWGRARPLLLAAT